MIGPHAEVRTRRSIGRVFALFDVVLVFVFVLFFVVFFVVVLVLEEEELELDVSL